ncbi:general stress protein [Bacillus sp. 179-C3.3 HS]|uniref:general stress protein n=1 Tax=Bacillus sp. 179-C3.3 HS TaxID=3232162 RepID=UPI00399F06E1
MSQIYSTRIAAKALSLHKLISLFETCQHAQHRLYVYSKKTMCNVKNIVDLEVFRLTHLESDCLIVVEGKKAQDLLQSFEKEKTA